jgi:transposase
LLKHGAEYVRQGEKAYEEAYRVRTLKGMAKKAESLGYKLVPITAE